MTFLISSGTNENTVRSMVHATRTQDVIILFDQSEICGEISSVLYYLDSLPPEMKSRIEIIRFEDIWERPNQFSQMIMEQAKLGPQDNLLDEYLYDQFRNRFKPIKLPDLTDN